MLSGFDIIQACDRRTGTSCDGIVRAMHTRRAVKIIWLCLLVDTVSSCYCCGCYVPDGPIRAGNVFSGMANWQSCLPWREHHVSFKITGVMTSKLYPSRLGVAIHTIADVPHEHVSLTVYRYNNERVVCLSVCSSRSAKMLDTAKITEKCTGT